MIALPVPARRAHLRSFWLALCGIFLGAAIPIVLALPRPGLLRLAAATAAGAAALGLALPELVRPLYSLWNRAAMVERPARLAVLAVCFFIIYVAGRAGGRLDTGVAPGRGSGWVTRRPELQPHLEVDMGTAGSTGTSVWTRTYVAWARGTGNSWAIVLLPFLLLLSVLADDEEEPLPAHIYTLF